MVSMAIASMWASMAAWFTPTVLFCAANLIIATIFIASNNNTTNNNHYSHEHHTPPTRISRVSSFLDRARSFKLPSYSVAESQYLYPSQSESESKTATYSSTSRLAQSIHANPVPPEITHAHELYPSEPETQALSQPTHYPSFFERVKSIKLTSDSPGQLGRSPSFLDRVRSFKLSFQPPETVDTDTDPGHNPEQHHVIRSKSEKTTVKKKKKKLSGEMKKSRSEMRMAANDEEDDGEDVDLRRPATARVRGSNDVDEEVDAKADDFISRFKQQLKLQRLESMVRYNQRLQNRSS
ncbi:pathogen-associated molecular patterns-induced protein A70 [Helianthus annuus]|nr:pathogen-associated molecular patterns-induced protein A70 [Helianthus annuus]